MVLSRLLAATALALISGAAAQAAVITYSDVAPAPVANPAASAVTGPVLEGVTGTLLGSYTSPFDGTAYADASYTAVQKGGSASYGFAPSTSASLRLGTQDPLNLVTFLSAGEVVESVSGADVVQDPAFVYWNPRDYPWYGGTFVTITPVSAFDTIVFSSGFTAFEFASLTTEVAPVPVPAAGLLLVGGLAGLGLLSRRRSA